MTKEERNLRNLKIVKDYLSTPNHLKICKKLCKYYGLGKKTYTKILKDSGIEIYNVSHNNTVNSKIFDIIDTEEKAYWLGFIFADGCVYDKNRVEISLAIKDLTHLEKFAKFIDPINKDKIVKVRNSKKYPSVRVSFRDSHMVNILNSYGCTCKKSLTLQFPDINIFKNDTITHFLRGYFDGDGCLCITDKSQSFSLLGTKNFLNGFQKYLNMDRLYPLYLHKRDSIGTYTFNI